jgi:hypothetical protein
MMSAFGSVEKKVPNESFASSAAMKKIDAVIVYRFNGKVKNSACLAEFSGWLKFLTEVTG